jgi:hypothetical protein
MNNTPHTPAGQSDILDRIRNIITSYVILPDEAYADIAALYVLHTHTFTMEQGEDEDGNIVSELSRKSPRTTPYLYITSQGPGSGKTRFMEVMLEICKGGRLYAGGTGPTFFRLIEARRPTIFLDEVDTIYSGAKDEDLRQVLNSGYKHNGSIPRVDPKSADGIRDFGTFCPKVLAGIDNGMVPTTVLDRAIKIVMERKAGEVAPFYSEDIEDEAADLADDIGTWLAVNLDTLNARENRPAPLPELSDRQNDMIRPLLTIADRCGWGKRARLAFLTAFRAQSTPLTPQAEALSKVRDYMLARGIDRISSARVVDVTGVSAHQVGAWFDAFGLQPRVLHFNKTSDDAVMDGQSTRVRGYMLDATMTEAWDRFLPAIPEQVK